MTRVFDTCEGSSRDCYGKVGSLVFVVFYVYVPFLEEIEVLRWQEKSERKWKLITLLIREDSI